MTKLGTEIELTTKRVSDIKGDFFVPSYQRGYRWTKDEVTRLLDDVMDLESLGEEERNYCLQPIVVKRLGSKYELIDGQQRLTTLYLILRYIHDINPQFYPAPKFSLTYETRQETSDYLSDIDFEKREDNIDFWFIANAYETVKEWFEEDLQNRVVQIEIFLRKNVQVIWYEVGETEDESSLFTRLNIGKIPLTNAELVKAMFLSSGYRETITRERQEEIALQWDNIERELHDDRLWYFLTNDIGDKYRTRIGLVLDMVAERPETSKDEYFTFFNFDNVRRSGKSLVKIWNSIQRTFLIMKDWFEDHELYHKIGYLIAVNDKSNYLQEIYRLSKGKKKDEFRMSLDDLIRESISIGDFEYAELTYENKNHYETISRLLLLFNVESVRKVERQSQRFAFSAFKHGQDGAVAWSLEHIHAQQSQGLNNKREAQREWLELHLSSIQAIDGEDAALSQEMEEALESIANDSYDGTSFEKLHQKVVARLSVEGNTESMHTIANLALLNTRDNAALNNSTFDVKREKIVKMDKKGKFIPFCTKMVFLKYYTAQENSSIHFWGREDREAYVEAINETLSDYLPKPIVLGSVN